MDDGLVLEARPRDTGRPSEEIWQKSRENMMPCSTKTMINLWFVNGIDMSNKGCRINGEAVRANLELSPQRKLRGKTLSLFFKALLDAKGAKKKVWPSCREIQISFWADVGLEGNRELAARYVIEDAGRAEAWWELFPAVMHTKN